MTRTEPSLLQFERKKIVTALMTFILLLLVWSGGISQLSPINGVSNVYAKNSSETVYSPVYIWFFGYVGNEFYPQTTLNISESMMVSLAQNLSNVFGKQRLVLQTAVDEVPLPNGAINQSMISTIQSYVAQLKQYARAVYGRLDFYQFNLTSLPGYGSCTLGGGSGPWYDCPIYNQSELYINELGLNGIWFDHPSQYYSSSCTAGHCGVGAAEFNLMMQNLTTLLPNATFIMNQTPGGLLGYVQQVQGDCGSGVQCTWESQTYASPSPPEKSLAMNQQTLETENGLFPGHVIGHFDAEGPPAIGNNSEEPMSIFADENSSQEVSAMTALLYNATHPALDNETYSMVVPLLGSWTCDCIAYGTSGPNYNGTLYNGLTEGTFARSTISILEQAILNNLPPSSTFGASSDTVGKSVSVSGVDFLPSSQIEISFDGNNIQSVEANSSGDFSTSIVIPPSPAGTNSITVSDGYHSLSASFTVKPSISEKPASAISGKTVKVTGYGFGSSLNVTIDFDGTVLQTQPATIDTNSTGSFTATYVVPSLSAGSYPVTANDTAGNTASGKFKIK